MKDKIISIAFFIFILLIFLFNLFSKDIDISYSEKRKLKQFPKITVKNVFNGDFASNFDDYTLDQFIKRDAFRSIKSLNELYIFNKIDTNNLILKDDYIYKIEYPLNNKSIDNFTNIINNINNKYLKNNKVYYSVVPDKSYFLNDNYIKLDYEELIKSINSKLDIKYIDIMSSLSISDYYKTDTHWKEENLNKIVNVLSNDMKFSIGTNYYEEKYIPFKGVYYGQLSIPTNTDELIYLRNNTIDNSIVYNIESDYINVYDLSKLNGIDPYDVFLEGASPYIEINTPINNNKELVIFRDSFGSSLAPLLLDGYSKVTLIDLRYTNLTNLEKYITFNNQDVLFLYSTMMINNSFTLKN